MQTISLSELKPDNIIWSNERRKVSELKDHAKNPRKFTKKGIADLQKSIELCGYVEPVAINTDNTILSGHARKKILLQLGVKEIDVRVPHRELNEKEQEAVLIRLNKNIAGEFDFEILSNEFELIELIDFGFEPYEVAIQNEDLLNVPGIPEMGERINDRICIIVHFDTEEDKADFIKQSPPISYLQGNKRTTAYRYPPSDKAKSGEWK